MALSMDEQRILDEIERGLANADPLLAARLSSFGFQRTALTLRTRRTRVAVSFITLVVVAALSLVVYAVVPFRTVVDRHATGRSTSSGQPAMTVPSHPSSSQSASAPADRSASRSSAPPATPSAASTAVSSAPAAHPSSSAARAK
jgi:cytoskeletal protein RodZ